MLLNSKKEKIRELKIDWPIEKWEEEVKIIDENSDEELDRLKNLPEEEKVVEHIDDTFVFDT